MTAKESEDRIKVLEERIEYLENQDYSAPDHSKDIERIFEVLDGFEWVMIYLRDAADSETTKGFVQHLRERLVSGDHQYIFSGLFR